jgi:hypothetical protein
VQTDLDRAIQCGLSAADLIERRAASVGKLSGLTHAPLTVAFDTDQVRNIAKVLRAYAATLICNDSIIAAQKERADLAEKALAEGLELMALIRESSLEELTAFWHRQQGKKQP